MTRSRLEAFSDGVIAIIITIMVLELKVPHGTGLAVVAHDVVDTQPSHGREAVECGMGTMMIVEVEVEVQELGPSG